MLDPNTPIDAAADSGIHGDNFWAPVPEMGSDPGDEQPEQPKKKTYFVGNAIAGDIASILFANGEAPAMLIEARPAPAFIPYGVKPKKNGCTRHEYTQRGDKWACRHCAREL